MFNRSWGYIDKTGKIVIPPQFDDAESFSEGLAAVEVLDSSLGSDLETAANTFHRKMDELDKSKDKSFDFEFYHRHGYIDRTGKFIIELKFDKAERFSDGLARVEFDGQQHYIDKTGKIIDSNSSHTETRTISQVSSQNKLEHREETISFTQQVNLYLSKVIRRLKNDEFECSENVHIGNFRLIARKKQNIVSPEIVFMFSDFSTISPESMKVFAFKCAEYINSEKAVQQQNKQFDWKLALNLAKEIALSEIGAENVYIIPVALVENIDLSRLVNSPQIKPFVIRKETCISTLNSFASIFVLPVICDLKSESLIYSKDSPMSVVVGGAWNIPRRQVQEKLEF
jgi:hypothetical protein